MDNDLKKLCKEISGRVVTFGLEEKYTKFLEKNDNITTLDTLNLFSKKKKKLNGKTKDISIKKLRKYFKKKKIDVILYQTDHMKPYLFLLPKELIYIGKKDLYLIGSKDSILETLPKFERYSPYDKKTEYTNKVIVHFKIDSIKSNKVKDFIYFVKDNLMYFIDILQDLLTN